MTLSEVSSMQEELPTDSTPESKASKGQYKCSHCVKSFVLQKSLRRHKKKAHPGIPEGKFNVRFMIELLWMCDVLFEIKVRLGVNVKANIKLH